MVMPTETTEWQATWSTERQEKIPMSVLQKAITSLSNNAVKKKTKVALNSPR